jgi:fructokinase
MTFLVCGEALYDTFVAAETPTGFTLDARIGGSAFNAAVGLARMGMAAGLFTGVGQDALGDRLAAELAREGVDIAYLRRKPLRTTLALVSLGPDGGARYAFYGEGAADRAVTEADLPPLDGIEALMFGCLSLLSEPTGTSFLTLARRAAAAGPGRPLVTLDPNLRPTVEPDMGVWNARVNAFAAHADLVKLSAEDLAAMRPGEDPAAVAGGWRSMGASLVVLTRGPEGATAWGPFGEVSVPAPPVKVVDTVGAGDGFLAALLTALRERNATRPDALAGLDRATAEAALGFAARAAAIACGRRGADLARRGDLPDAQEA